MYDGVKPQRGLSRMCQYGAGKTDGTSKWQNVENKAHQTLYINVIFLHFELCHHNSQS